MKLSTPHPFTPVCFDLTTYYSRTQRSLGFPLFRMTLDAIYSHGSSSGQLSRRVALRSFAASLNMLMFLTGINVSQKEREHDKK